jgi:phosphomannomutase
MKKIVLFDIDGTLTPSRCVIEKDMVEMLSELQKRGYLVGAVGGSDQRKHFEQLQDVVLDYHFCENGLVAFAQREKFAETRIEDAMEKQVLFNFVKDCHKRLEKYQSQLPLLTSTFVEVRTGMINICPIGRDVTSEQRKAFEEWDVDRNIRLPLMRELEKEYGHLFKFSMGGKISIDAFPHGWDKTWCLQYLDKDAQIWFFGDMTHEGGNDHEIFNHPRVQGVTVQTPQHTLSLIRAKFF